MHSELLRVHADDVTVELSRDRSGGVNWRLAGEDEEEANDVAGYDRLMMPQLVVSLEAGDEFLRERVINLPEPVVVGTHNTDEAFTRRLTDYRSVNTDEDTVFNYFDELEFHPERIGPLPVSSSGLHKSRALLQPEF